MQGLDDAIVDDATWAVRQLVADIGNWWFGKKVLLEPRWALRVNWEEGKIFFNLSRQAIKDSPSGDGAGAADRAARPFRSAKDPPQ